MQVALSRKALLTVLLVAMFVASACAGTGTGQSSAQPTTAASVSTTAPAATTAVTGTTGVTSTTGVTGTTGVTSTTGVTGTTGVTSTTGVTGTGGVSSTTAMTPTTAVTGTAEATAAPTVAATAAVTGTTGGAATTGAASGTLSVICRCVAGGANDNEVKWITQYVIPEFQKQNPNAKINLVQFGGSDEEYKARLALDLKSGSGSDIMAFDGFWVPEFVQGGLLKPLNEVAGSSVDSWEGWSHIPATVQGLLKYQDKLYGVPLGTDARVIWYRKDILKKAGLPDNWQPKSWNDLLDAARTIKKADPNVTPLQINAGTAMGEATTLQGWYMVFLGTGQNVYDFKTNKYPVSGQPFLDALNFYKTVYVDEKLGDARLQLLKDGRDRSFTEFRDGQIAMLVEGDYFWRSVLASGSTKLDNRDQLVGWAKMPAQAPGKGVNGQDFVTASGGTGFTLNPNTKNAAAAWALMSFMFSKASLDQLEQLQPTMSSRNDVPVPNDPVMTAIAKELLPITVTRPPDPAYSTTVSPQIQLMTERVVSGQMSPQQAMDAYATAVKQAVGGDKVEDVK